MIAVPPPKPLPNRTYVTLTAALTSLMYEHAFDLAGLLAWAKAMHFRKEDLRSALTDEWLEMADYACKDTLEIRGCRVGSSREIRLTRDDLRNCRYVGWWSPEDRSLSVDPFPLTFSGGFRSSAERDLLGFRDVVVCRADLLAYKKVRRRLSGTATTDTCRLAEQWLLARFEDMEPMSGLRDITVARMKEQFGITTTRAREIWRATSSKVKWPVKGRPSNAQKRKRESLIKQGQL